MAAEPEAELTFPPWDWLVVSVPRRARLAGAGAEGEGEGVPDTLVVSPLEGGRDAVVFRNVARESRTEPVSGACHSIGVWVRMQAGLGSGFGQMSARGQV